MGVEEGGVSYETLQELLRSERRSNKLTPVPNGFWRDLRAFLQEAEEEFHREQRKDPWARRAMMLSDRVKNARHAAETVWALRERKLAMLALAHAKDGGEPDGLTKREVELYGRILGVLQEGRRTVFEDSAAPSEPGPAQPAQEAPGPLPGEDVDEERTEAERVSDEVPAVPEPVPEPTETPAVPPDRPGEALVTIRALGDIPPFVGPDMQTYLLQEGDLASVPGGIAQLLVRRGKAAVVDAL